MFYNCFLSSFHFYYLYDRIYNRMPQATTLRSKIVLSESPVKALITSIAALVVKGPFSLLSRARRLIQRSPNFKTYPISRLSSKSFWMILITFFEIFIILSVIFLKVQKNGKTFQKYLLTFLISVKPKPL